jgi:hypothetical protein
VLELTPEALGWWKHIYRSLKDVTFAPQDSMRPLLMRSTDHVLRIAAIYALTEGEAQVGVRHMEAGLAWVEHSVSVVVAALGGLIRDPVAGRILASLRGHPGKASTMTELHRFFQRLATAAGLRAAIEELEALGLAYSWKQETGGPGRPVELNVATTPIYTGKAPSNYFNTLPPPSKTANGGEAKSMYKKIDTHAGEGEGVEVIIGSSRYPTYGLDVPLAGEPEPPPPRPHRRGSPDIQVSAAPSSNGPSSVEVLYRCPDCQAVAMGLTKDRTMLICDECEFGISTHIYEERHGAIREATPTTDTTPTP